MKDKQTDIRRVKRRELQTSLATGRPVGEDLAYPYRQSMADCGAVLAVIAFFLSHTPVYRVRRALPRRTRVPKHRSVFSQYLGVSDRFSLALSEFHV
jgi:hypothetical protein